METIEIGGTPYEENCAATGKTEDAQLYNRLECRAYIRALEKVYGPAPEGSRFRVKGNSHDFGTYYEVTFTYDYEVEAHREYAKKVEQGLRRWLDANFWAPVSYDENAQPFHTISNLDQLVRDVNPRALSDQYLKAIAAADAQLAAARDQQIQT